MNAGTGQDEVQRIGNFGQGAEENPTVAQSQPIVAGSAASERGIIGGGWSVNGRDNGPVE